MDSGFKLNGSIIGAKGMHIKHLERESGAKKIEMGLQNACHDGAAQQQGQQQQQGLHIVAGSEQVLQRAKELASQHLDNVKEAYLRWQQHGPQAPRRWHSESAVAEWGGRRTPGRGMAERRQSSRGSLASAGGQQIRQSSTLGDFFPPVETPAARTSTE